MKKRKIFGKHQLIMAALVLVLGGAVWLNMEYASGAGGFLQTGKTSSLKNLGDTKYVMNESVISATETAAKVDDYFAAARTERSKTREEALKLLEEAAEKAGADAEAKAAVTEQLTIMATRMEKETSAEALIKAKGFADAVVIIGDQDVNVIVQSEELLQSQILQIQDAIVSEIEISLENIKIVHRK